MRPGVGLGRHRPNAAAVAPAVRFGLQALAALDLAAVPAFNVGAQRLPVAGVWCLAGLAQTYAS